jgi:hypothetical protein
MQCASACNQRFFGFDVIWIGYTAVHRANGGTSLIIMEADALGAKQRVDDKDRFTLRNRVIRALGLTRAAVDALVGNHRCHELGPPACIGDWDWRENEVILDEI